MENIDLKIFTDNIEDEALIQVKELSHHPSLANSKIRIMPDVHAGKNCVIGFTATTKDKIIPSILGNDLGCGVGVYRIGKIKPDLDQLDKRMHELFDGYYQRKYNQNLTYGLCQDITIDSTNIYKSLCCGGKKMFNESIGYYDIASEIGTLGGGNHFIEIAVDSHDCYYLLVHTGSRGLGGKVFKFYNNLVKKNGQREKNLSKMNDVIKELRSQGRFTEIENTLISMKEQFNKEEEINGYLSGEDFHAYVNDVRVCQEHATRNRKKIISMILNVPIFAFGDNYFESVHNYLGNSPSFSIIRKGAVSAHFGQKVIIPINMRDGSLFCIGRGNEEWNYSAPHGAVRVLSRTKAKENITLDEFKNSMKGIYSTSISESTIDESPMAYKDINEIKSLISDTVNVLDVFKTVYNYKQQEQSIHWKKLKKQKKEAKKSQEIAMQKFPNMTIKEIDTMENHIFSLLKICEDGDFNIAINNQDAGIYSSDGTILAQLCLSSSNLAKRVTGEKTND